MIRRPPRSTHCISSAASDVYKRQTQSTWEYLQGYYRNNKFLQDQQQNEAPQFLSNNLLYGQNQQALGQQYIHSSKNYVDVEANSKMFFTDINPFIKDYNRPNQDFSNVQNIYMNQQRLLNLSQPEAKEIYPRQLVNQNADEIPKPDFLRQNQIADAKLKYNIEKLGGIQDTVKIMEESLKQNEVASYTEKIQREQLQFNQMVNQQGMDPTGRKPPIASNPVSTAQYYGNYNSLSKNPYNRMQYQNIQPQLLEQIPLTQTQTFNQRPSPLKYQPQQQQQQQQVQMPMQFFPQQLQQQSQIEQMQAQTVPQFYKKVLQNNIYADDPLKKFEEERYQKQTGLQKMQFQ
eukprot:TRINITY_DN7725_c0_g1_i3.p1 TRINITY_DN7725_c0_g1~~TRINITY_DN7725_c0_g1_i3.p1  ORF type:complete len:346 (-),score=87.10 TRINITY_DN7725_c0_g1_i3:225-1262(-)